MRVLHIGKFFPPHPGGIERTSADLAQATAAKGIPAAVLAHAEPGTGTSHRITADPVDVTLTACHGQFLYAPVSPAFPFQLRAVVRRFKPDLIHLHLPNTSAFWALLLPSVRRVPWILHWHADIPLDAQRSGLRAAYRLYRPWEQAMLRRARAVIVTSAAYRDSSTALAPWNDKTRVIALGIPELANNVANATGTQWAAGSLRVLAVGRLSYFKGFDVLLRAIANVPHASLMLVGDGECAAALRVLAQELGIASRVTFAGRIDQDETGTAKLAAIYASADVFCLPSTERAESFGLVLLEAMRAGLPAIASAIPGSGIGHVVVDGVTGILVPPGDSTALTSAITCLGADPSLRKRLGDAGRERWRAEFTLESTVRQTLALYRELLGNPGEYPRREASTPTS